MREQVRPMVRSQAVPPSELSKQPQYSCLTHTLAIYTYKFHNNTVYDHSTTDTRLTLAEDHGCSGRMVPWADLGSSR